MGHTLSDNRHGLIASAVVTIADGHAERDAAKAMISDASQAAADHAQLTLGADKGYDAKEFVQALQEMNVQPHIALDLPRFHGQLKVLDLVGIVHQIGDGGVAVV